MTSSESAPGVIVQRATNKIDRHPTALKFYVKDGHLFVQSHSDDIAVYAPSEWRRAKHGDAESWEQPNS
ncbi:hypothetical protein [Micromonospora sp. HUAS LYJ1]|uniref:hypothetical protein n=1 Tax=Micromonospora sp. HUAS LYJ1 TaxID=3061626 RepID=UPI0026716B87|nr:hypothetical protein [Micromonospora sp. HUAS LYJ1]WKU03740.1 hypothetical protein Q2K16_23290 [Micromonospora sp. HUAS LYJ1]